MYSPSLLLALIPFLPLISTTPLSPRQASTCGTVLQPSILQFINESSPTTSYESDVHDGGQVTVFQNVQTTSSGNIIPTDRIYTIIGFTDIPSTAYGCQLSVYFPPSYPISTVPAGSAIPPLDIYTFGVNQLGNDPPFENGWDWYTPSEFDDPAATLFGTVTLKDGVTQVINSASCPFEASGGLSNTLAFTAQIAGGVDVEAGVGYNWFTTDPEGVGLVGFYLTYDC